MKLNSFGKNSFYFAFTVALVVDEGGLLGRVGKSAEVTSVCVCVCVSVCGALKYKT